MKGDGTPEAGSTRTMPVTDCRHFNGYKPCGKSETCDTRCSHLSIPSTRVLVVHLEALGAVLRSTALLPAIRRKFPGCHITWVTQKPADQLLMHNPMIDRVMTTSTEDLLALSALEFDVAFSIDKGMKSSGVLKQTHADLVYGFQVDPRTGAVLPVNQGANELWQIGLSNHKKFYVNEKTETRLAHEALELGPWMRDPYVLELSASERKEAARRREAWARPDQIVIGLNTGCSAVIPYKKLSIEVHRELIERLLENSHYRVVLLGGREDTLRNQRIGHGLNVVQSSTEEGLRDGIVSVEACDIVVTGDSLGMHIAIALGKWTVAWFGPTCAHEIDLYDRGVHVLTEASCSPCWKRSCDRNPMCYDLVSVDELMNGVLAGEEDIEGPLEERPRERSEEGFDENRQMRFGPPSQMTFEITEATYEVAGESLDETVEDDGYEHVTLEVASHGLGGADEEESEFEICLDLEENQSHIQSQSHSRGPGEPNI